MLANIRKFLTNHISIFIALIAIIISFLSLINSIRTRSESRIFGEINTEVQWSTLLDNYQKVDNEIRQWEESKGMKRNGDIIKNRNQLDVFLNKLKTDFGANDYIIRLYIDRSDRYESLLNVAKRYEVVSDRLKNIDFNLPAPPKQSGFPYTLPFKFE